jgi:hypothetical protein
MEVGQGPNWGSSAKEKKTDDGTNIIKEIALTGFFCTAVNCSQTCRIL